MTEIGKNIKALRMKLGLTQEELAAKVGYKTKSAINKIELGVNDLPQKKIVVFADALETTPAAIMGWSEETYNALSDLAHEMHIKEPSATDDEGYPDSIQKLIDFAKTVPEDRAEAMLQMMQALSAQFDKMAQTQQADS